jgi:hypothetical protein
MKTENKKEKWENWEEEFDKQWSEIERVYRFGETNEFRENTTCAEDIKSFIRQLLQNQKDELRGKIERMIKIDGIIKYLKDETPKSFLTKEGIDFLHKRSEEVGYNQALSDILKLLKTT